jgi:tetratricopeptide (TPR) repeat protein
VSGAIAAAMGAFTVRHFWTRIKFFYFFVFFFRPFWGTFHLPAFVFLPFWFIEQIALKSLADFMGGSDVAYLAHIAGYTFGAMAALTVRATDFEKRYLAPKLQQKQVEAGVLKDPRFNKACELMDSGSVERAKALFDQLISARPDDFNTLQDIASIYKEKGLNKDYCELAGNILKNLLLKSRFDEASSLALGIASHKEPVDINPQLLMRVGKWLTEQRRYGEAHDIYRSIISGNSSMHVSVKASLALAKLLYERMDNPRDALSVIVDARDLVPDAEWAERLSEMENTIKEMHPEFSKV